MEAETLVDTRGDTQALVDTVADSLANAEAESLGDTLRDGNALVKSLSDSPAEVAPY